LQVVSAGPDGKDRPHPEDATMMILKILFAIVVAIVGLTLVGKVRQKIAANPPKASASAKTAGGANAKDPGLSAAGFFLVSRDAGSNSNVIIMTVPNCPSDEAARAQMLQSSLLSAGIPCEMRQDISFNFTDPSDFERVNKYTSGGIANPVVIVRGWAKGNPTAEDVISQYSQNH